MIIRIYSLWKVTINPFFLIVAAWCWGARGWCWLFSGERNGSNRAVELWFFRIIRISIFSCIFCKLICVPVESWLLLPFFHFLLEMVAETFESAFLFHLFTVCFLVFGKTLEFSLFLHGLLALLKLPLKVWKSAFIFLLSIPCLISFGKTRKSVMVLRFWLLLFFFRPMHIAIKSVWGLCFSLLRLEALGKVLKNALLRVRLLRKELTWIAISHLILMKGRYFHFYRFFSLFLHFRVNLLLKLNPHWTRVREWLSIWVIIVNIIFIFITFIISFIFFVFPSKMKAIGTISRKFSRTSCGMLTCCIKVDVLCKVRLLTWTENGLCILVGINAAGWWLIQVFMVIREFVCAEDLWFFIEMIEESIILSII